MTTKYKLGSLFDGSGGFPLAGALCGIEPVWAAEIEPYPIAVTRSRFDGSENNPIRKLVNHHFPNMKLHMVHIGNICKINGAEIEPVDIITFGSPCQDLSVAGRRAGLKHEANGDEETTRSGLFMEAVRIIKEMRKATNGEYPRFALWENVPGAFSSNNGEDFRIVCEELIKVVEPSASMPAVPKNGWPYADSYVGDGWSLAYRVFDAQYWGVPQRRRRIHLVADFRGECARKVLFEREGVRGYFETSESPWQTTPSDAERGAGANDQEEPVIYTRGYGGNVTLDGVTPTLEARAGTGGNNQPIVAYSIENHPADSCVNIDESGKVQTLTSRMGTGGGNVPLVMEPKANFVDVEMEVAVRKHEVNCTLLCQCLRDHKKANNFSNKAIAEALNRPITLVEHWFRSDNSFSIPDPDVWFDLKNLLGIETTEFDQSITEFEYNGGNYDMRNRIHTGDIAPTLTCGSGNTLHLLPEDNLVFCLQGSMIGRADKNGPQGGGVNEDVAFTCNTIDRHAVAYAIDQQGGKGNANYAENVMPTMCSDSHGTPHAVAYSKETITLHRNNFASTLMARDYKGVGRWDTLGSVVSIPTGNNYIVRRLTPIECARLQGFADWWGHIEPKENLTDEEYRFWLEVRNTHATINGKETKDYTKAQMLTWYNKLYTDSAEYKMWGNGIALPPALYCMQGIADALAEATRKIRELADKSYEPTDLSDAPEEVKAEIIENAELLNERAGEKETMEEETMGATTNTEPTTTDNVITFNAVDQLKRLADERKVLANIKPDNKRFSDDVRALEYAVGVLEAVGL